MNDATNDAPDYTAEFEDMSADELAELGRKIARMKQEKAEEERKNKPPTKRGRGVLETTKRILLDDQTINIEDLYKQVCAAVGQPHPSYTVCQTTRSDFLNSLRVIEEAGRLLPKEATVHQLHKKKSETAKPDGKDEEEQEQQKATGD